KESEPAQQKKSEPAQEKKSEPASEKQPGETGKPALKQVETRKPSGPDSDSDAGKKAASE
ncbi:MAG: hypothetical protein P8Z78_14175, partial [Gammaproteobacteria bacterium]